MSVLTIAWTACASASAMLGLIHLLLWLGSGRERAYLFSSVMALSASFSAIVELRLLHTESPVVYAELVWWGNLAIFFILVPMVWFIDAYFRTGRRWLLIAITTLWTVGIVANLVSPGSLTFTEVHEVKRVTAFWGESFSLPAGTENPWKVVPDIASILVLIYVLDASVASARRGNRRRALIVGGSVTVFILLAGIHTPLVDAGLIATPYMISFAFLAIVLAMSTELAAEAMRAQQYYLEVRSNEERWRRLLENIQLAVVGVDPEGRINFVNRFLASLTEYPPGDLIGLPLHDLILEPDRRELGYRLAVAAESGPRPHSRRTLRCASGRQRTLDWSTVRLVSPSGEYTGLLSLGEDITDRLKAQDDLRRSQRDIGRLARANLLGELASTLAHELNQPLTAILSNAQATRRLLDSDAPDVGEIAEILDDIVRDDKRAADVISRLRTMLRRGVIPREPIDVNTTVREVVKLLAGEFREHGIALDEAYAEGLPSILASKVEIQQVAMNLLVNAVRAVREQPGDRRRIGITTELKETFVEVAVSDSGSGIAPDAIPRLFEAFFSEREDGLGMGLAISRRIIESHGGPIRGENAVGGGAVFCFGLPLTSGLEGH